MRAWLLLLALPCAYWVQAIEHTGKVAIVTTIADAERSREALPTPGITARAGVASPTRAPWIVANGWRFMRDPAGKFMYEVPAGKGVLAAAEAAAYGADAIVKIDAADTEPVGALMKFLETVPAIDLPGVADLAVVDDRSPITGEVMNLLSRRNLLFKVVQAPAGDVPVNVKVGSPDYPAQEAADPSAFALKIRHQLGDDRRTLRLYGSEVVICRLTGDANKLRLQLLNYGGRDIEGLRVRLRGTWRENGAYVSGAGRVAVTDLSAADGGTEFSIPKLTVYAVLDLARG
jgi:hypothetical protein